MEPARYGAVMCLALGLSDLVWLNASLAPRLARAAEVRAPARVEELTPAPTERLAEALTPRETIATSERAAVREHPPRMPVRAEGPWSLAVGPKGGFDGDEALAVVAELRAALVRDVEAIVVASVPAVAGGPERRVTARLAELFGREGIAWSRVSVQASLRKDRRVELELGRIGE